MTTHAVASHAEVYLMNRPQEEIDALRTRITDLWYSHGKKPVQFIVQELELTEPIVRGLARMWGLPAPKDLEPIKQPKAAASEYGSRLLTALIAGREALRDELLAHIEDLNRRFAEHQELAARRYDYLVSEANRHGAEITHICKWLSVLVHEAGYFGVDPKLCVPPRIISTETINALREAGWRV